MLKNMCTAILFIIMKYVDAHCHLNVGQTLTQDVDIAITNAAQVSEWQKIITLAQNNKIWGAIGVHPWYISNLADGWTENMQCMLAKNPELMVGEIGLDKNYPDMQTQIFVFQEQLKIANDMKRIAHVHCVGAWDKILATISKIQPYAIVFHAFDTSPDIIQQLLRYNSYFSFGTAVCNPNRTRVHNALRSMPRNRILSESDSDNPATVIGVVQKMSEILSVPLADMINTIYNNTVELLKHGQTA